MKNLPKQLMNRLDAADSFFLSQQLQSIDPTKYYNLFAGKIGRRFIPAIENISPVDTVYKYAMTSFVGRAKKGAPHAKDHRSVQVVKTEVVQPIKDILVEYGWTVQEIRASRQKNLDLDGDTLMAAMGAVEDQIDRMLAFGDPSNALMTGLLNNASINSTTPTTKTGSGTAWTGASVKPSEIIKDVTNMIAEARAAMQQATEVGGTVPAFQKFTLLLPQQQMSLIASTPRSDNSDTTILQWLLQNNPWLASVEDWWRLDTADAGHSNGPMAVLYPALPGGQGNPLAFGAIIPVDFESLDPQFSGHDVIVPASARCGGVAVRYPVAFRYLKQI